jgi:lipoyl-dependent peroxiredoxin
LNSDAGSYFLRARLNVSVPGVGPEVARELLGAAHNMCPYSKATHGNINVATNFL